MTLASEILSAIRAKIAQEIPEIKNCYLGEAPQECERPYCLIGQPEWKESSAGRDSVQVESTFDFSLKATLDGQGKESQEERLLLFDKLVSVFRRGLLIVGERNLHVKTLASESKGQGEGPAPIKVKLEFFDSRGIIEETPPNMETIETQYTVK